MSPNFPLPSSTHLPWRYLALLGALVAMFATRVALYTLRPHARVASAIPCVHRNTPCVRPCSPCPPCPYAGHGHWSRAHL
jgi:hypothetical protein